MSPITNTQDTFIILEELRRYN